MGMFDRFRRTPEPLAAAAVRGIQPGQIPSSSQYGRQAAEAWAIYRCLGEVHYAVNQQARIISQLDWTVTIGDGEPMETEDSDALMRAAFGENVEALVERASQCLQVPGGYYLARTRPGDRDSWKVLSSPLSARNKKTAETSDVIVQVRIEDPEDDTRNDSWVLGAMDTARDLILCRAQSRAQSRSRTAQHGMLLYPIEGVKDAAQFEADLQGVITAPLSDERSTASVTPNLMGFPAEFIEKVRMLDMGGNYDEKLDAKDDRLVKSVAVQGDFPPELLLGFGDSNHWCRPVGTLAFTRSGWAVPEVGEDVLTVDGWATVRSLYRADATGDAGLRLTVCNTHGGPHSYTLDATVGHRFYVERDGEQILTTDPRPGDVIYRGIDQRAHLAQHETYRTAFAELLAWYSSDGTLTGTEQKPGQIRIAKGENWPYLEAVLTDLWGTAQASMPPGADKPMWREEIRDNGVHVAVLNAHARNEILAAVPTKDKAIPLDVVRQLTAAQMERFLLAWSLADGTDRNGLMELEQRDPARLAAPEYAAIQLGYGVRRWTRESLESAFKSGIMHGLRLTDNQVRVQSVEQIALDGEVWCPTTDTGTWLALDPESGWTDYTGNSTWAIQEDNWRGHTKPMADPIGNGFATAIMRATEATGIKVEPDPGPLLVRRPTVADTATAYENQVVSGDYYREQLGADETDAPTPEEIAARTPVAPAVETPPAVAEPRAIAAALEGRMPQVAAAKRGPDPMRLQAIDTQAFDSVEDLVNDTADRAMERLGAKVRTMAQGSGIDLPADKTNAQLAVAFTGTIPNADAAIADTITAALPRLDRVMVRAYTRLRGAGVDARQDPDDETSARALFTSLVAGVVATRMQDKAAVADAWQAARRVVAVAGGNSDPATIGRAS